MTTRNHPSYNTNSPEDAEAGEKMVRAMSRYRVTNSAGGTELRTRSRSAAIAKLNRLQFPGDVLVQRCEGGAWATLTLELDDDGMWAEPA